MELLLRDGSKCAEAYVHHRPARLRVQPADARRLADVAYGRWLRKAEWADMVAALREAVAHELLTVWLVQEQERVDDDAMAPVLRLLQLAHVKLVEILLAGQEVRHLGPRDLQLRPRKPRGGERLRIGAVRVGSGAGEEAHGEDGEETDDAESEARHAEALGDVDDPGEVGVRDEDVGGLLPDDRLLRRPCQCLVEGGVVDAPPFVAGGGEVLDARREASHIRERILGDADHAARHGAVPLDG
ncbi:Os05g0500101 [Oryza sativa Japonica Group]|uniref:Os05g0500101 protein n=1 Tax=Oryza sativa subsp. japonica TaxID=39947 RepID=A0A0N7KL15_ORYSJ|nr:hypothetical protein EE612_030430 [Oryza sativa]BAS94753.1 Os05g0500101 [Oryza sativa Japonica Group]